MLVDLQCYIFFSFFKFHVLHRESLLLPTTLLPCGVKHKETDLEPTMRSSKYIYYKGEAVDQTSDGTFKECDTTSHAKVIAKTQVDFCWP